MRAAIIAVAAAVLGYVLLSPTYLDLDPLEYHWPPLPALEGVLEQNHFLLETEFLFDGQIIGPESIEISIDGHMYLSLADGRIVRSIDAHDYAQGFTTFARTGEDLPECGTSEDFEPVCGRPLGLRFDLAGNLIVADAYKGLLSIDTNGRITSLASEHDGVPFKFTNDVAIAPNGTIYFTHSSTRVQRRQVMYEGLEHRATGRLYSYDPATAVVKLVLDNVFFANGVEISPSGDYLVVVESTEARITRLYLSGDRAGQTDVFADNLPCVPDNIRYDQAARSFWLGCLSKRAQPFALQHALGPYPGIRRAMIKLLPYSIVQRAVPRYGLVLKMSEHGDITRSLHDPTGRMFAISEVHSREGCLYFGSFRERHLGRICKQELL
eukprot:TRINITY_DN23670_c0_g1_i1.p1 TRINITY_DN23670_c0_g1~~TRINITY_DN23670_c0_g1_i1.p1  ORF type:complete len:381 (-),score=21.12 TRINITY_DN23670_c0_g1_i1:48-1190(-)